MDTDTLAAASILQNVTVSVADEGGTVTGAVSGMYDDVSGIVAPCDISEAGAEEDRSQPPDDSRRAPLSEMVNDQNPRRATRSSEVPTCPGEVPVAASEQPDKQVEPPTVEMLKGWAAGARQTHRLDPFDEPKQVRACSNRHASAPRQLSSIVTCAADRLGCSHAVGAAESGVCVGGWPLHLPRPPGGGGGYLHGVPMGARRPAWLEFGLLPPDPALWLLLTGAVLRSQAPLRSSRSPPTAPGRRSAPLASPPPPPPPPPPLPSPGGATRAVSRG